MCGELYGLTTRIPLTVRKEAVSLGKRTIALKLLTNRKVRQAAMQLLKDPRADKKALAAKLISNQKVRQGAVELLKEPRIRDMLVQQATQRFRRQ